MITFEEDVRDIEGLTDFELGVTPYWFSTRLRKYGRVANGEDCTDATLIARLRHEWLGEWGTATIDGEAVFLFEYLPKNGCYADMGDFADEFDCGWHTVEDSERSNLRDINFFTKHGRPVLHRRTVSGTLVAN